MASLYEIVEEIKALNELIEYAYSEENINEETGEFKDMVVFKQIEMEIQELLEKKGSGLVKYIKYLESNSKECKEEADRLKKKEKAWDNKVNNMKEYIKINMMKANIKKIETAIGNFVISESTSTEIDKNIIDKKYGIPQPIDYKFDAKDIKKRLMDGEQIDGARLVIKQNINLK